MGRQDGLIQLKGAVANMSFYKNKIDGYLARKKGGVTKERIETDPKYDLTRKNMAEFARAGLASKVFRKVFRSLLSATADKRMTGRLTRQMVKVIREDAVNLRGERNVIDGEATLLEGFQFNVNRTFDEAVLVDITASIDRATGAMTIDIPAIIPTKDIAVPEGATHFRFKTGGAAIDFEGKPSTVVTSDSDDLPVTKDVQGPLQFSLEVPPGSVHPLFLICGIEFLQKTKAGEVSLMNNDASAMAIVKVDGGVAS
jgi:hypothetical protein